MNSTIVTRLEAGTKYRVRVKAVSDAGHGMWSAVQTERTYMSEFFSMTRIINVSISNHLVSFVAIIYCNYIDGL